MTAPTADPGFPIRGGKADLTAERLLRSVQDTVPLTEVMKDQGREYTKEIPGGGDQERIVESRSNLFVPRSVPNPD